MILASVVTLSGTLSLATFIVAIMIAIAAAYATWRAGSVKALRDDVEDWKNRYAGILEDREELKRDNDRQAQRIVELTAMVADLRVEVGRLQERTDTTTLAKEAAAESFREEMRAAVGRLEAHDEAKFALIRQSQGMIQTLIERDPALRTRSTDRQEA